MKSRILYSLLIVTLIGCNDDDPSSMSLEAESFLDEMMDVMEDHSINKNTIDWPDFRQKVVATVPGAQTFKDTYPGISEALKMLGDNHSFLIKPDGGIVRNSTIQCNTQSVIKPAMPSNIGYVKVNSFSGTEAEGLAFSKEIQQQIKSQDNANIVGWIVDLRSNGGGNMWPMLAGVGPILGEGICGYFIDPDGVETWWGYQDGSSVFVGDNIVSVSDPYELIVPNPKVAVLLDNAIASSGEVIAISFIDRANTRSFGSSTCGLSTANQMYALDGSHQLFLTVAYLADRNKNKYGIPIVPDQSSTNGSVVQDAIDWIQN